VSLFPQELISKWQSTGRCRAKHHHHPIIIIIIIITIHHHQSHQICHRQSVLTWVMVLSRSSVRACHTHAASSAGL
jgi:hypothetical protein